jgi:sugar phosphate isomerase/epimerase
MAYLTGFADEAGKGIDAQIRATRELGWTRIEARSVDGTNLTDVTDAQFDAIESALRAAGVAVNCFGSAVANWGKDPLVEADFQRSVEELERAIPRMKRLGTRMIRCMSFRVAKELPPDSAEVEANVFRKVAELVRRCEDAGVLYLHENCMNYGGQSWEHTLRLLDRVKSHALRLVFDTGNPVFTADRRGREPYKRQSSWEFYRNVRQFIEYVHVKDGRYSAESGELFPKVDYTWPGDGDGDLRRIVSDLAATGYDGGFSMEPHMTAVFHAPGAATPEDSTYANYVEYGRRFVTIAAECGFTRWQ